MLARISSIREGYSPTEIKDDTLQTLELQAKSLGFKLLARGEVAVNRKEYDYLKQCERQIKKHRRSLDGWPVSLV